MFVIMFTVWSQQCVPVIFMLTKIKKLAVSVLLELDQQTAAAKTGKIKFKEHIYILKIYIYDPPSLCFPFFVQINIFRASILSLSAGVEVHVSAALSATFHTRHLIILFSKFIVPVNSFFWS